MAKPLRSPLNQVRAWVQQGRTDAWIAHQLDVSTSELREFRRRHELDSGGEDQAEESDLRDEIEAEIEAEMSEEEEAEEEGEPEQDEAEGEDDEVEAGAAREPADGDAPPRRRRRRRGGRGRSKGARPGVGLQASFDHGEDEGFGLWLDPTVQDDPVYSEHWAGHRPVEVTIEPDRIVIRRTGAAADSAPDDAE